MAVTTLFGLYEWLVMLMGCRNTPATHQCQMYAVLHLFIGKICHIYLDDIIVWSTSVAEHLRNVESKLAEHTARLTPLTTKEVEREFPKWGEEQQLAFDKIKNLVLSWQCLTVIDHETPGNRQIFVTCDASERGTGAVLLFGTEWKTARLVAFESMQLKSSEKNYPVHKNELLAILRALSRWCFDLLGSHFKIFMDHRMLEYFLTQKDLSW